MTVTAHVLVVLFAVLAVLLTLLWIYRRFPVLTIYKSKAHLEHAFDSFDDPLAVIDQSYTIQRINRSYAELVSRAYMTILGNKCYAMLRGRSRPCEDCLMKETLKNQTRRVVERSGHPTKGTDASISLTFFPFTGWNRSFFGDLHLQGLEGVAFFTQQKVVMKRWFESEASQVNKDRSGWV